MLDLAAWKWLVGRDKKRWGKQAELTLAGVCQKHRPGIARNHGSTTGVQQDLELLKFVFLLTPCLSLVCHTAEAFLPKIPEACRNTPFLTRTRKILWLRHRTLDIRLLHTGHNKEFDSAYKTLPGKLGGCVEPVLVILLQ